MEREPTNRRLLLWSVAGALAVWGLLLGVGSYLGLDPGTPDRDVRRLAFVGGSVAVFLAIWLLLLWRRGPR
jgi:membrane protein DedA with SNARE-associated domain